MDSCSSLLSVATQKQIMKHTTVATKCTSLPSTNMRKAIHSLGKAFFFYSKERKVLFQWFFKLIQNILKGCHDIHEVNLSHMYWILLALALLQHIHKKLTANHDIFPALFTIQRILPWNCPRSISSTKLFASTFKTHTMLQNRYRCGW